MKEKKKTQTYQQHRIYEHLHTKAGLMLLRQIDGAGPSQRSRKRLVSGILLRPFNAEASIQLRCVCFGKGVNVRTWFHTLVAHGAVSPLSSILQKKTYLMGLFHHGSTRVYSAFLSFYWGWHLVHATFYS